MPEDIFNERNMTTDDISLDIVLWYQPTDMPVEATIASVDASYFCVQLFIFQAFWLNSRAVKTKFKSTQEINSMYSPWRVHRFCK